MTNVSLVGSIGVGNAVYSGLTVTGTYGQSPTANNVLVAVVEVTGNSAVPFAVTSSSSGWSRLVPDVGDNAGGGGSSWSGVSYWVKVALGGDAQPVFSYATQIGYAKVYILELTNANTVTPLDTYGFYSEGTYNTANTATCHTTGNVANSGEYAINVAVTSYNSGSSYTPMSGFTNKETDSEAAPNYFALDVEAGPTAGSPAGGTATWSGSETWVLSLVVIAVSSGGSTPGTPTGLTVTGETTTNVSLSWTAPSGSVTGYYIYQGGVQVGSSTTTSYTATGLTPDTGYTFTVAAYNANGSGSQTSGVVGTTLATGSGGGVTAPTVLPGNILTVTDSDFESGTPSWAAFSGANAPSISSTYQFSGNKSLKWTANSTSDSYIASGYYPCTGNNGYDVSGYILTPGGAHYTYIGLNFYTSSHTFINTLWGNYNPSTVGVWQPIVADITSPSNAAYMEVTVWVSSNVVSNEIFAIDLAYLTDTIASVWVDWYNPSFISSSSAGQDFMDLTPWVRLDQNISLSHGRQDAVSEIQTGQASFDVQNDLGWFTPQKSGSPYFPYINLGARTQINAVDELGDWYTRFDGPISEITYGVDDIGETNLASFSLSDVLAYMNRQDPISCWTVETVMADDPWFHWTLNDTGAANIAAETSGNNGPPLHAINYNTSGTISWGNETSTTTANSVTTTTTTVSSTSGVETLANAAVPGNTNGSEYWYAGNVVPSSLIRGLDSGVVGPTATPLANISLNPNLTTQTGPGCFVGTDGYQLNAQLTLQGIPAPLVTSTNSFSIEAFFCVSSTLTGALGKDLGPFTVFSLGSSRQAPCLVAAIYVNSTTFGVETYAQAPAFAFAAFGTTVAPTASVLEPMTPLEVNVPHHIVVEITAGSPATATGYLDGVDIGSINLPTGQIYDTICVGGAYGGHGNFAGNISCVSIYNYLLNQTQINVHCMAGEYGWWEQTTDNCVAELGVYAGIPTFWNNLAADNYGLSLADYYNIAGATPLSGMQMFEQTERGLLYVNMSGQLTFHTRDWRMGYGSADVILPSSTYNSDLGYELVDTFLLNEAATSTYVFTTGVDWISVASQESFGAYSNGTITSPVQLPLITWSRSWETAGLTANAFWPDPNLDDNSSWQVYTRSSPRLIPGTLTVDLLTHETNLVTITQMYGIDTDNMLTLHGLPTGSFPDQTGVDDFFIEGINETIGLTERSMTFYVSPASIQRAWQPGDPNYGLLGTTSRLGISGPDTNPTVPLGKSVSHDAGPPYWPPAFQTIPGASQIGWTNVTTTDPVITPYNSSLQGDCILVQVLAAASSTITVADNVNSGNYTAIGSVTLPTSARVQYLFAYFNALPLNASTATITITTSTSQEYTTTAYRIWGISGLDIAAHTVTGTSTSPAITGSGPMTYLNDFELVIVANDNTEQVNVPEYWVQMGYNYQGAYANQIFWRQATSETPDAFSATLNGSSTPWGAIAVSFAVNSFSLNNPANNGHDFFGMNDMRGLHDTLATMLNPPLLVVGQNSNSQSISTGNQDISGRIIWDTIYVDTVAGMGVVPGWSNWYCVQVPGFYEINGSVFWEDQSSGAAGARTGWIVVAQQAASLVALGTGSPYTGTTYVCPIGETVNPNNNSYGPVCNPATRLYLGVGDMVGLVGMHTQGSTISTNDAGGGSLMSLRWVGYATTSDQQPTIGLPGGATVINPTPPATKSTYTKAYRATGTYSYYGGASTWGQPRNHNGDLYQGWYSGASSTGAGSQTSFALFNGTQIASDTSGATINYCHLIMQNQHTWYDSGANLMVGWSNNTSWGGAFPSGATLHPNYSQPHFNEGATQTVSISATLGRAFQSSGATALMFGDNSTENLDYYGYWTGGTSPQLVINYTK